MKEINFGFIGAGQIAGYSVKPVNAHPQAKVLAAHDLNPARLKELCEEHQIERSYDTVEKLLADPDIHAVYIAVPNKFHAPISIQALKAGKHVILDKPFAMNLAEAEEVAKVANASGKVLMLGMNLRYETGAQKIRALAKQGVFGDIYHAKAYWLRREGVPKMGTWFGNKELAGGGCLYDIGVHLLDLCLYVIDNFEPVSVYGKTYTLFGNRGIGEGNWGRSDRTETKFDVDDFATATIKFQNGATVSLDVAWACHIEQPNRMNIEVFGTEAGACTHPPKIFRRNPIRENYEIIEDPRADVEYPDGNRFINFINTILGTEQPCTTIQQALTIQKILDAIAESSAKGTEVTIS